MNNRQCHHLFLNCKTGKNKNYNSTLKFTAFGSVLFLNSQTDTEILFRHVPFCFADCWF